MATGGAAAAGTIHAKRVISKLEFPFAPPYQSRARQRRKNPTQRGTPPAWMILLGKHHFGNNNHKLLLLKAFFGRIQKRRG
jgi:hypothetical protein